MGDLSGAAKERLLRLMRILEKNGPAPVTSAQVETITGWPSHTIRKDISCLGAHDPGHAVGHSNGYAPDVLIPAIKKALGLDRRRLFCVAGLGRLGSAYLNIGSFEFGAFGQGEFELAAGFDTNVNRVEILKSPVPLYPAYKMGEVIRRFSIEMALLCVPGDTAQAAAEKLTAAGIRGIVNFAPVVLKLPQDVAVRNVYVVDELRELAIRIRSAM
jgi:redox-sensing transcriptional repressor